jgi:hypothetical protein
LITEKQTDGTRRGIEWKRTKIIPIRKFRAAASYFGLASCGGWSTHDWLRSQAREANNFETFEEFAISFRDSLEAELSELTFRDPLNRGIGIHLTGYERIGDYWIPELFFCTNFGGQYREVGDLGLSRETFGTICSMPRIPEHRDHVYRMIVHEYLQRGRMLMYNNGDPEMFNPAARSILTAIETLRRRGKLINPNRIETYRSIARRPIQIVSVLQRDLCRRGERVVGGRIHDLQISPSGRYFSDSGDNRP